MQSEEKSSKERRHRPLPKWPDREEYLQMRESYVNENWPTLEVQLSQMDIQPDITKFMCDIILQTQHAFQFAKKQTHLTQDFKIGIFWPPTLHKQDKATTAVDYTVNGQKVKTLDELYEAIVKGEEVIKIDTVNIGMNVNEVKKQAKLIAETMSTYKELYPNESSEEFEKNMNEYITGVINSFILAVIEEFAHALYFISITQHNKKLEAGIKDILDYDSRVSSDEKMFSVYTDEEIAYKNKHYYKKRIEVVAQSLVKMFDSKYLSR